ncbi:hypothetical protein LguiA_027148 [Lonicera macranthoides]
MVLVLQLQVLIVCYIIGISQGQLRVGFYTNTCPDAESIVGGFVRDAAQANPKIAPALLRLHFHDCFGCDGSILIENGANAERNAFGHQGVGGFEVIEKAKSQLEALCPGVVSCADIVALAARDAIALTKGPSYEVETGRRDGVVSDVSTADKMPDVSDSVEQLKTKFQEKGLSAKDLVLLNGTLSLSLSLYIYIYIYMSHTESCKFGVLLVGGHLKVYEQAINIGTTFEKEHNKTYNAAHTIGTTACFFMTQRLYNFIPGGGSDPAINPNFLQELKSKCPKNGDVNVRLAIDQGSEQTFDSQILQNIRSGFAVLQSDARLYADAATRNVVDSYFGFLNPLFGPSFEADFANSMVKMGRIEVKTGSQGTIRRVCRAFN